MKYHSVPSLSTTDRVCDLLDKALKTLWVKPTGCRSQPACAPEQVLTPAEKRHSAGLMRVNHVGEVCAQALYQGQTLTAESAKLRQVMQQSADEEVDHLAWCAERLLELNSHPSLLNPVWYLGALTMGIMAGLAGDRWSLGFVAETERQVAKHLESHLQKLPAHDLRSRTIVAQMHAEESEHAHKAVVNGAHELPYVVRKLMAKLAKVMTRTAYYL